MTTFPKAEQIARDLPLQTAVMLDPEALELYGVHALMPNIREIHIAVSRHYHVAVSHPAVLAGVAVVDERIEALNASRGITR